MTSTASSLPDRPPSLSGTEGARSRRDRSVTVILLGSIFLLTGVDGLFEAVTEVAFPWGPLLPVALIVLGLLALRAHRNDVFPIIILASFLALASVLVISNGREALTGRSVRPHGLPWIPLPNVALGDLTVDLSGIPLGDRSRANPIEPVKVGVGDLVLRVPEEMAVRVDARSGYGTVRVLGRVQQGFRARVQYEDPWFSDSRHRLTIVLAAGIGDVIVER